MDDSFLILENIADSFFLNVPSEITLFSGAVIAIPGRVFPETDIVFLSVSDGGDFNIHKDLGVLSQYIYQDEERNFTAGSREEKVTVTIPTSIIGEDLVASKAVVFQLYLRDPAGLENDLELSSITKTIDISYKESEEPTTEDSEEDEQGVADKIQSDTEEENTKTVKADSEEVLAKIEADESLPAFNAKVNPDNGLLEVELSLTQTADAGINGISSYSRGVVPRLERIQEFLKGEGFRLIKDKNRTRNSSGIGYITDYYTFSFGKADSEFKRQLSKESLKAIKSFDKIASLVLAEPYLYCETPEEAKEELNRIQKVLGKNVIPIFFQSIESFVSNTNHVRITNTKLLEKFILDVQNENFDEAKKAQNAYDNKVLVVGLGAETGALGVALAAGAPFPPVLLLALAGAGLSGLMRWYDSERLENSSKNKERVEKGLSALGKHLNEAGLKYDMNEYIRCKKTFTEVKRSKGDASKAALLKTLMKRIVKSMGEAKEVQRGINEITSKYLPTFDLFTSFEEIVYKIGAGGKVANILKQSETQKTDLKNPLNFYSQNFIGRSLYLYLDYLFSFPYDFDTSPDTTGYTDLWKQGTTISPDGSSEMGNRIIEKDGKPRTYLAYKESDEARNYDVDGHIFTKITLFNSQYVRALLNPTSKRHRYFSSRRFSDQNNRNDKDVGKEIYNQFFKKNRELLKLEQKQKINILLAIREALVEQVVVSNAEYFYDKEEYREIVESFAEDNLFERMNDSAYPDIDLPKINLNFNKVKKVSPAFYYFNPKLNSREIKKLSQNRMKILKGSLTFKERVKDGIISSKPVDFDNIDTSFFMKESKSLLMNVSSPGESISSQFISNISKNEEPTKTESGSKPSEPSFTDVPLPKVSINLGGFASQAEYKNYVESFQGKVKSIREKVSTTRSLFGGKHILPSETVRILNSIADNKKRSTKDADEVESFLNGLSRNLGIGTDVANYSNIDTLTKMNERSQKNAFSTKGMQNAFPTFRLYIVEEDSIFSGKLTAYDDFYSYGSVIGFDVNSSKDMAASTASIKLQNVSGILDGTKKSVIRDIDIDSRNIRSNQDDAFQEYIDSVVLRPGINIQLRAGYENNTKDLDILISGRISDINYSSDGMSTNIIVQSYGVELEQKVKNSLATSSNSNKNMFYSTHQLLGSLILSPELKHFGRIKVGKVFQAGSTQELALDVKDYSNRSNFVLNYTNSVFDWLAENALALSLVGAFAPGVIKVGGKLIGKLGWTRSLAASVGRAGSLSKAAVESWVWKPIQWATGYKALAYTGSKLGLRSRNLINGIDLGWMGVVAPWVNILPKTKQILNKGLMQIKSGSPLTGDVLKEIAIIERNMNSTVIKHINDITEGLSGVAQISARQEAKIMAYVLQAEGMTFQGIRNFSYGGLGTAKTAILNATEVAAVASSGFWRSMGSGLGRHLLDQAKVGVTLGVTFGLIGFLIDMLSYGGKGLINSVSDGWRSIFSSEKDDTLKIMLSPQDDNIYPPNPVSYLREDKERGTLYSLAYKIGRYASEATDVNFFHVPYALDNYIDSDFFVKETLTKKYFEDFKLLFDTRLVINSKENEYELKNQTIFSVFHEMSLRHPGYVYGARPYGQSMEYRMFFGLGDQNYWSKDLSFIDSLRLNKIIKGINNKEKLLTIDSCKVLYPKITKQLLDANARAKRSNKKDIIFLKEGDIQKLITYHSLKEYLEKTEDRFKPFRLMHLVDSSKNIVSNDITVSAHNVINTVTVHYKSTYNKQNDVHSLEMAANTAIKENNKRQKVVSGPNIVGPANAYRYGISELMNGAKNVYTGSVLVLGNTKINPWDILVINDNVNRMYGPVEVRSVTHSFNHQTGFLTNVEVSALVSAGDDMLSYGTMSTSIIAQAKEELYKEYSSRSMIENSEGQVDEKVYLEIIEGIVEQRFPKKEYKKEIRKALIDFFKEKLKQSVEASKRNGEPVFLEDIITGEIKVPENIRDQLGAIGAIGTVGTGVAIVGEKIFNFPKEGLKNIRSPVGWGMMALFGGFLALSLGKEGIVSSVESSLNSGNLGKNLFRPVLFSKISNQNLIEVYPLVKDGKPLLTGGFENIPADQTYSNVIGNIFSMVSDGFEGYLEKTSWLNSGASESVLNWDDADDFIKVKESSFSKIFKNKEGNLSKNLYHYYSKE